MAEMEVTERTCKCGSSSCTHDHYRRYRLNKDSPEISYAVVVCEQLNLCLGIANEMKSHVDEECIMKI